MKFKFDDSSYLEFSVTSEGKICVILAAKDGKNSKNTIINSAEITEEDFFKMSESIKLQLSK